MRETVAYDSESEFGYIKNIVVREGADGRWRWFVNAWIEDTSRCVSMGTRSWSTYTGAHNDAAGVFPQLLTRVE